MPDFTDQYNTQLSPEEEGQFQSWAQAQGRTKDLYNYDMRGWWKANQGGEVPAQGAHFTDEFKKPNHPTFSNESMYQGKDGFQGGSWGGTEAEPTFTPGKTNLLMQSRGDLENYFSKVEPNARLMPGTGLWQGPPRPNL